MSFRNCRKRKVKVILCTIVDVLPKFGSTYASIYLSDGNILNNTLRRGLRNVRCNLKAKLRDTMNENIQDQLVESRLKLQAKIVLKVLEMHNHSLNNYLVFFLELLFHATVLSNSRSRTPSG